MSREGDDDLFGLRPEEIARLQEHFDAVPLHALLGLRFVERSPDRVVLEMPVREEALGGTGNLHGGAIATLCDVASASAAARNSAFRPGENSLVTADLHVRYLGRPKGEVVRAEAHVLRAGQMLVVVECRVVDGQDNLIAVADFSGMVVPLRQPLIPGTDVDPGPEL